MTNAMAASVRAWFVVSLAVAVGLGCGAKPPYRVSESRLPSAEQIRRLGRIEMAHAGPGAAAPGAAPPRIWIGVPDRRPESAVLGAITLGLVGAAIGGLAAAPGGGWFADLVILEGMLAGGVIGAAIGVPVGLIVAAPGKGSRRVATALRRAAEQVDVNAAAREGAADALSRQSASGAGTGVAGPGGILSIDVVAHGTRAAGGPRARPFVAVRTRLAEAPSGRVLYEGTRDWRGEKRYFGRWDDGGAADFARALEQGAREMGRRSVNRVLQNARRR